MEKSDVWGSAQRALAEGADDALVTVEEYRAMRNCSRATAWRSVKAGAVDVVRIGRTTRIRLGSVRKLLRGREEGAP